MKAILLTLFSAFTTVSFGQIDFWDYKKPSNRPEKFPTETLLDSGFVIGRISISNDGREFYYTYARKWYDRNGSGVMMRTFDGSKWSVPTMIAERLSEPTLSPDQQTLYFGGAKGSVWKSVRTGNTWTNPVKYLENAQSFYNFMPTSSGTLYVGSNGNRGPKNDYSKFDFSVVQLTPSDTLVTTLGQPLNTDAFEGDFYISPDESYIIISTKETPNFESELWISFRKKDKSWSKPISPGEDINQGIAHRFGQYVSPDGKYLFFTKGTSEKDTYIYWLCWDKRLKKLKRKANLDSLH